MQFVFDLDDTLLDRRKAIGPITRAALIRLMDAGDQVVFATSRPSRAVRRFIDEEFLARVHLITLNGAVMRPVNGPVRLLSRLGDRLRPVLAEVRHLDNVHFSLETDGERFATNGTYSERELAEIHSASADMLIDLQDVDLRIVSKMAIDGRGTDLLELAAWIDDIGLNAIPALGGTFLNIVDKQVDKATTLRELRSDLAPDPGGTVAFGDDLPDLAMLEYCNIAVAMGNAEPAIKAVADHVIGDCDEDAIGAFIDSHFQLT